MISPGANNSLLNVPTDQMRGGDFSALGTHIIDPTTGSPFPGNIIPTNRLNTSAQKYLQLFYPQSNFGTR